MPYFLIPTLHSSLKSVWKLVTGRTRIITISILLVFTSVYFNNALDSHKFLENGSSNDILHYAVIIDAGSSGSRVHLYTWPPYSSDNKLIKVKTMKDSLGNDIIKDITPGLSYFSSNPSQAFDYIHPLLLFAGRHIPVTKHSETPLFVLATAGMRLLPEELREAILESLRVQIKSKSSFYFSPKNVQVITGKEEGIYSWISVNYLLGRFEHPFTPKPLVAINLRNRITTRPRTVGMLEMGGASAQIAFEITSKSELEEIKKLRGANSREDLKDVLAQFDLKYSSYDNDQNYLLYVTTFLGLGVNVAKETYLKYLIENRKNAEIAFQSGLESQSEENVLKLRDPCLCKNCPTNITTKSMDGLPYNLSLIGLGNFEACEEILKDLINTTHDRQFFCNFSASCPLFELHRTRISFSNAEFYGFSELWYTMEDVLGIGGKYDYSSFKKIASEYCSTDYILLEERLLNNGFPNADNRRLLEECFKAGWISTVLHSGLKMPKDFRNYQSALAISNVHVSWTLGFLLYRVRPSLPHAFERTVSHKENSHQFFTTLFLISLLITIAAIVIYLKHFRTQKIIKKTR